MKAAVTALSLAAGVGIAAVGVLHWQGVDLLTASVAKRADDSPAATRAARAKPLPKARVVNPEPSLEAAKLPLTGRTAPAELAFVASRATGVVAERRVDIGDRVERGDVLSVIDAPEVEQELMRARATLAQSKARLELAKQNLERADVLAPKGHISEQVRDERRTTLNATQADVEAAEAEVRRLEEVKKFQTVTAPFAGTIVERRVERGDKVSADQSAQANFLYRIARLDELRIEIDVPQSAALRIRPGSNGVVTFAELPGRVFKAVVKRSTGLIDAASSTMRMELTMANPDGRIPAGLNGQVTIDLEGAASAFLVPANTLLVRDGRQSVAVVDNEGKIEFRSVSVGRDLGQRVEVISGLAANDRVVLSPNALLKSGDKVDATSATAETKSETRSR